MQPVRVPELIGVRFDGMGRAVGQAAAAPVLREQGFARVFGAAEAGEDVVAPPPIARRRDGVGYLNEDALLAMLTELHERTGAALAAGRFPVVYGADCSVLLATVPALKGAGGHAGLLHLDAHEDATPMARTDSGEAANMEIGLLAGLDGERPAADMPVPLPALGPDMVAILGVRDAAFREELDVPSVAGQVFMRTGEEVGAAPRDRAREAVARLQAVTPAWWLHVDLDVLSWQAFRACGAPGEVQLPGGLSWEALTLAAGEALRSPGCRGWSVAIYNPDLDPDRSGAARIVAFARDVTAGVMTPA
jgi:arginase